MAESDFEFSSKFNEKYNIVTRKIVRELSEDSRISISDLSKKIGMSRMTIRNKLKRIEEEFGVHYTAELNENLLKTATQHLIVVKFDKKPDYDKIKTLLEKSYIPQLAITVKGGHDLIIYAVSISTKDYAHWDKSMQIRLAEYGLDWKPSEIVHKHLGFCPLRVELLDKLEIPDDYKGMLKILNSDSRTPFRQISKDLKMHFNTVAYNFNKLMKAGYIRRFTITMDKPANLNFISYAMKFKPMDGYEKVSAAARKVSMTDDQSPIISTTILSTSLIGSYDLFLIRVFDDYDAAYKKSVLVYKKIYGPMMPKLNYGEVDKVIVGRLPIRSIDIKKEYSTIVWDPDLLDAQHKK